MKTIEQLKGHARDHAAYGWTPCPYECYGVTDAARREVYLREYRAYKEKERRKDAGTCG